MPRYRFNHAYRTQVLGPWEAGDEVELDEDQAEFIKRDSPGALSPAGPPPRPGKAEAEEEKARELAGPPGDRMQRRGRTR